MALRTTSGAEVVTIHREQSLELEQEKLSVNFSDSISAAIALPIGDGLFGLMWPNLSTKVTVRLHVAESAAGTYRVLRKSDGTGEVDPYNGTSTSAAGAFFVSDMAPFRFCMVRLDSATKLLYRWRVVSKG